MKDNVFDRILFILLIITILIVVFGCIWPIKRLPTYRPIHKSELKLGFFISLYS